MSDDPARLPATLTTADGVTLGAAWTTPDDPRGVAVLTHPHPLYGGDMDNIVPASFAERLPGHGLATVRFDFRGGGRSGGTHGGGTAETGDVRAAIDAAAAAFPDLPVVAIGYSFGADVLLAVDDTRLAAVVAVAPPLAVLPEPTLAAPRGGSPTLVLSAEHDQIRDVDAAAVIVASWPATTFAPVVGADHFLAGAMGRVTALTLDFLRDLDLAT